MRVTIQFLGMKFGLIHKQGTLVISSTIEQVRIQCTKKRGLHRMDMIGSNSSCDSKVTTMIC